jgi:pyruvate dehydrogenase E2 component (dihydrolipoamide acetyltransferase)
MAEIRMPKMGDGMEEGTLLRWLKKEGDRIEKNESIAEIETDKANVEMPAEDTGILTQIVVQEGQTVPVGAVLAHVGATAGAAPSAPSAPSATNGNGSAARPEATSSQEPASRAEPESAEKASQGEAHPSSGQGSAGPARERLKASPLARKMAEEAGIDLAQVTGSGPGGRIVERDIAALKSRQAAGTSLPSAPTMPSQSPAAPSAPSASGQDVEISKMRKRIAKVTVQSKQTVPHFYLVVPIEMDRALQLLDEMNAQNPGEKITVNDLIVKACAVTLQRVPEVNVSFTPEEKIRRYASINIGVAVVTEQGLAIPVVPDCGSKTLRQISADAKSLIGRARGGTITPQEMSGGTFSISNLGMFGIEEFMAIINPPEAAMLAVGAAAKEVVVAEDGSFEARSRMRVSLSCDHRAVDGALGARFLQELKRLLESPLNLLA